MSALTDINTALHGVVVERANQERLKASGKFTYTCADPEMSDAECYVVLGEEFGEVGRAILTDNRANLRAELTQVAAVAVAWLERLARPASQPDGGSE